jgi:transcriptional regulator with XRE-family HTH domain
MTNIGKPKDGQSPPIGSCSTFGEKLKSLRKKAKMSQTSLGEAIGTTKRSVINYETGFSFPRDKSVYNKIAALFGVSVDYLMSERDEFIADAYAVGGSKGRLQAEELVHQAGALFAGGALSDEDKDAVFYALQEAYWIAKTDNKKYASKRTKK